MAGTEGEKKKWVEADYLGSCRPLIVTTLAFMLNEVENHWIVLILRAMCSDFLYLKHELLVP